jgi:hypothetical protein
MDKMTCAMRRSPAPKSRLLITLAVTTLVFPGARSAGAENSKAAALKPEDVLRGLRVFYRKTARADGSFAPGSAAHYPGMSDCAYSDLAALVYAVTIHKTFGWELPHEKSTITFLLGRQQKTGEFINVGGTVDPRSAEGKVYNTTQALVALHALGVKPQYEPLPVFDEILAKHDLHALPPYMSSFFPLAYLCSGQPIPKKLDLAIRATMVQDATGYLNDHIAATFHASHYYHLVGAPTPRAPEMIARIVRDQKANGSWLLHAPARDRHATFDAVFTLRHEGGGKPEFQAAIDKAVEWALQCRNSDGGFGHFPGSPSDADAIYFQVGTLLMGGFLKPVDPLPKDPHLLSWGHLMPVAQRPAGPERFAFHSDYGWIGAIALDAGERRLALGSAKGVGLLLDLTNRSTVKLLKGHDDAVTAVQFSPDGRSVATGSFDRSARIWDAATGKIRRILTGHRGPVMSVAFSPKDRLLATGSIDATIKLWHTESGALRKTLAGHQTWVNALAFAPKGDMLLSAGSDGTVRLWNMGSLALEATIPVSKAEVRSVAWSPDGKRAAAGLRYGTIVIWNTTAWQLRQRFQGHGGDVWSLAFTADSKRLVSGDGDWNRPGLVKIWDAGDGKLLGKLQHTGEVLALAVSAKTGLIAAGGADGVARVWASNSYDFVK